MKYLMIVLLATSSFSALAVDRKDISDVDTDLMVEDTQVFFSGTADDHFATFWWIPVEFWQSTFLKDPTISPAETEAMLQAMEGVSIIAVVQADISVFGAFRFYPREEIASTMSVTYIDHAGNGVSIVREENVNPDLELLLDTIGPLLTAAMGEMGQNMHFYVYSDYTPKGERLVDPHEFGKLEVNLKRLSGEEIVDGIEMPLNSLFEPRICPNGKPAHVQWSFCPWSGEALEE